MRAPFKCGDYVKSIFKFNKDHIYRVVGIADTDWGEARISIYNIADKDKYVTDAYYYDYRKKRANKTTREHTLQLRLDKIKYLEEKFNNRLRVTEALGPVATTACWDEDEEHEPR